MLCCDTARGTHSRRLAHIPDAQIISMTDVISFLSRHCYYYSCVADEAGYLASVFVVSIPGIQKITSYMSTRIHISLWHRETAAERRRKGKRTVWMSFLCSIYATINVKPAGKGGAQNVRGVQILGHRTGLLCESCQTTLLHEILAISLKIAKLKCAKIKCR